MPDVFLSYSREDAAIARWFADGFERSGLGVWWDATLRSGEAYDRVTEKALKDAAAVVVLWSRHSVDSRWVRSEATLAERFGTLVPAMIENCDRPVMFELTHTADLSHWRGDVRDPAWLAFVTDVRRFVERPTARTERSAPTPPALPVRAGRPSRAAIVLGLGLVVALAVGSLWFARRPAADADAPVSGTAFAPGTPTPKSAAVSVAVMPFANVTGESDKEYFSDGMAEELINSLAKVRGLDVASRTSSFAYKGKSTDVRQIARALRVTNVLEGSVRSAGAKVRVTAQLTNAESGYTLWSESYERDYRDLFQLQDDLAREIVTAFKRTVGGALADFEPQGPPTSDLEAYGLYLRAQASMARATVSGVEEAMKLLDEALRRDPGFGRAWGQKTFILMLTGASPSEVEDAAKRTIALDPAPEHQLLLAQIAARKRRWVEAEDAYTRLLPQSRDPASTHQDHVLATLWSMGKLQQAQAAYEQSVRLAPALATYSMNLARILSSRGNDDEAERWLRAAAALGTDTSAEAFGLVRGGTALHAGRLDELARIQVDSLPEALRADGADALRLAVMAMRDPAQRGPANGGLKRLMTRIDGLRPRTGREWRMKLIGMNWFSLLGDLDDSYRIAEELRREFGDYGPVNQWAWLWNPELAAFRRDPRFQPFVARLGMMEYWQKYGPPDSCDLANGRLTCR